MSIQSRDHFPLWLTENGLVGTGVEIGTYYGAYAHHILINWPGNLISVDPYINYPKECWLDGCNLVNLEEAMQHALKLLEPFGERFRLIRKPSVEAAAEFEDCSLDWVYLDGNHDLKHVSQDIIFWYDKVKPGGVLGGHDYGYRNDAQQRCDVMGAVNDFCKESGLKFTTTPCTSWWIINVP